MLQKLIHNKMRIAQLLFLIGLFVLIRFFENQLFYDPFLHYFKAEKATSYPDFISVKLYFNLFFRYFLNSIISLAILQVLFKDVVLVKFSGILLCIFFILLILIFFVVLHYFDESFKMILFYIRRFIIQPIFILLFIPGFYFQKITSKK
jgi:exosortase F-associated protein